jgi:hypothetical protein
MAWMGIDPALKRSIELGQYEVNSRAVAEAMIRSGVLVPTEARDGAVRAEED